MKSKFRMNLKGSIALPPEIVKAAQEAIELHPDNLTNAKNHFDNSVGHLARSKEVSFYDGDFKKSK